MVVTGTALPRSLVADASPGEVGTPLANRPRAAAKNAQERQKPWEVSHGGMRSHRAD
jgi:hypothetical protein